MKVDSLSKLPQLTGPVSLDTALRKLGDIMQQLMLRHEFQFLSALSYGLNDFDTITSKEMADFRVIVQQGRVVE